MPILWYVPDFSPMWSRDECEVPLRIRTKNVTAKGIENCHESLQKNFSFSLFDLLQNQE